MNVGAGVFVGGKGVSVGDGVMADAVAGSAAVAVGDEVGVSVDDAVVVGDETTGAVGL